MNLDGIYDLYCEKTVLRTAFGDLDYYHSLSSEIGTYSMPSDTTLEM